jgi:hypothetical protein
VLGEWCYRLVPQISTLVPAAAKQWLRSGVLRRVDGLLEDTCIVCADSWQLLDLFCATMASKVRRAVKVKGKLGNCTQVILYGSLSVVTTLEFFEHHFAKVGHRLAPYDPTLSSLRCCRHHARESVCREAASFKPVSE